MDVWTQFMLALAMAMARPLGLLMILPVFTSRVLGGALVRNALVLVLALPLLPLLMNSAALAPSPSGWSLVLLLMAEVMVGALLGFFAALPFWAIGMAGFILDTVRGSSMASVLNPMLGEQASVFGILFSQVLTVLYLISGGFNTTLRALYDSYRLFSLGTALDYQSIFVAVLSQGWHAMWEMCLLFALPAMAGMLLVDVALGFVNRSAQQLNVFFVAMPVKSGVALLLLAISMPYALKPYMQNFSAFGDTAATVLGLLR